MKYPALHLDPAFRRQLWRWFSVSAVFYVLAATISIGYDHPDQHFQTLEFAASKLSGGSDQAMAWEYYEAMRPWLQPFTYFGMIRGLQAIGIDNPLVHDWLIRLASGALGLAATVLFTITLSWWLPLPGQKRWLAIIFAMFWLFPSLYTRTASESLGAAFLLFALSALFLLRRDDPIRPLPGSYAAPLSGLQRFSPEGLVISAVCFGLMFHFRYQTGPLIVAAALWMLVIARVTLGKSFLFCLVVLCVVVAGVGVDSAGYGSLQLAPWNYIRANLLEGAAADFGREPWHYYFTAPLVEPVGLVLILAMSAFWIRHPLNLLTWMTVSFIVEHSIISHKELRFIFPIVPLVLAMVIFSIPNRWFEAGRPGNPFFGHARWVSCAFVLFAGINVLALAYYSLKPPNPEVAIHRFILSHEPERFEFVSFGSSPYRWGADYKWGHPLSMNFYAPHEVEHRVVATMSALKKEIDQAQPIYYFHDQNDLPDDPSWDFVRARCRQVHQTFGPLMRAINFNDWQGRSMGFSIYVCSGPQGAEEEARLRNR